MHRHDLFPLSLMELLLSSHLGIFYALIPFYTNEQPNGSAKIMPNSSHLRYPISVSYRISPHRFRQVKSHLKSYPKPEDLKTRA